MFIEWTQSSIQFEWSRFPLHSVFGVLVLIENIAIGLLIEEDKQPYASMQWR